MKVVVSARASATSLASEKPVTEPGILSKLDGATDGMGGFVEALDRDLQELGLRGGEIELKFAPKTGLRVACSFVGARSMDHAEMQMLLDAVVGQWSDGAGENFDPPVAADLGIVIHLDQGDRRVELYDRRGKRVKVLGGEPPSRQLRPEEEVLLQAIYEQPTSDERRSTYAKWLTKRGDPRGEFITLQLRAAGASGLKKDERRAASLLAEHWRGWGGPCAEIIEPRPSIFRRGFLEHAHLKADFEGAPPWDAIVNHPSLSTLASVTCLLPDQCAAAFLSSKTLERLKRLVIPSDTLEATEGLKVVWRLDSLSLLDAQPRVSALDLVRVHPGLSSLKSRCLHLRAKPPDLRRYQTAALAHPVAHQLTELTLQLPNFDPETVIEWLTPRVAPGGSLKRIGLRSKANYFLAWHGSSWSALDVELEGFGVGEFVQVAPKLAGQIRRLRVFGPQKIPDFHRTLLRAVDALGPLEQVELPPAPTGS